ncbi:MAG: SCO family protein [Acetobacteraceae bacterium]
MAAFPRRRLLIASAMGVLAPIGLARAAEDVRGSLPSLAFRMQRADDERIMSETDLRGSVVLLYFGYTFCPDLCPTTLANLAAILDRLGALAARTRVLFVTVDPARDTAEVLRQFIAPFGPGFIALRPTPDALAAAARRYRVAYSVQPAAPGQPYAVSHGAGVYVFDPTGAARTILTGLEQPSPDIDAAAAAVRQAVRT